MTIAHIVPGSGTAFYCENCLRDTALVKAQRCLGHTVVMAPLYLPFLDDAGRVAGDAPVFYGALNVYVSGTVPGASRLPCWLKRLLDAPPLLRWAASKAGSTSARSLEPLTLSMLRGERGFQAIELERLVAWLGSQVKPDIVHLSNALLLGLAGRIKEALGVPVVCSLQDEDTWIDAMSPAAARQAWDLMARHANAVSLFTPVSRYYAEAMEPRLHIGHDRMRIVHPGIELDGRPGAALDFDPPVIGYLSRLCPALGLGTLVDAFIALKRLPQLRRLRLRATGGMVGSDAGFVRGLKRKLAAAAALGDAEVIPVFDKASRSAMMASLSVLSVPVGQPEAFGMFVLEALAAGVPVVEPCHGAFPETIEATGGGITYDPAVAGGLETALSSLLLDPGRARSLGARGRAAVLQNFSIERMARSLIHVYQEIVP